jgi:hypothetical protein
MAAEKATQAVVNEAADQLIAEGKQPTSKLVKDLTGGSYSTIQRRLETWRKNREQVAAIASEIPGEVRARVDELTRDIWVSVQRDAQRQIRQYKVGADTEIATMRADLDEALAQIVVLEGVSAEGASNLEQLEGLYGQLEIDLAAAREQVARIPDLERTTVVLREELHTAQQQLLQQAAENGRLIGEADALRKQISELLIPLRSSSVSA